MTSDDADRVDALMETADLANALGSDRFKQLLDHVPVAIAVSELHPSEVVTYANLEFARLTGQEVSDIEGKSWRTLPGIAAAADGPLRGILEYCTDPIVSRDIVGNPHSSIFDSLLTQSVAGGRVIKVFSWYDNEWGFSNRMVDAIKMLGA